MKRQVPSWEEARRLAAEKKQVIVGAKRPCVCVAMGMYRYPRPKTIDKVIRLVSHFQQHNPGVGISLQTMVGAQLHAMRTGVLRFMLENEEFTHLLFVDDDMDWPVGDGIRADGSIDHDFNPLTRMMSLSKDVVGALCFARDMGVHPYVGTENAEGRCDFTFDPAQLMGTEPFRVDFIGFGMILVRREVLEGVVRHVGSNPAAVFRNRLTWSRDIGAQAQLATFLKAWDGDQEVLVAEIDRIQATSDALGEDYSFCKLARLAGFEVWCDPAFDVAHIGDYPYGRVDWWHLKGKALAEKSAVAAQEG